MQWEPQSRSQPCKLPPNVPPLQPPRRPVRQQCRSSLLRALAIPWPALPAALPAPSATPLPPEPRSHVHTVAAASVRFLPGCAEAGARTDAVRDCGAILGGAGPLDGGARRTPPTRRGGGAVVAVGRGLDGGCEGGHAGRVAPAAARGGHMPAVRRRRGSQAVRRRHRPAAVRRCGRYAFAKLMAAARCRLSDWRLICAAAAGHAAVATMQPA